MNELTQEAYIAQVWEERAKEQDQRNSSRLYEWAGKRYQQTGRWPALSPYRFKHQHHSNVTVLKFPRRKHQIMGSNLPTEPDTAA